MASRERKRPEFLPYIRSLTLPARQRITAFFPSKSKGSFEHMNPHRIVSSDRRFLHSLLSALAQRRRQYLEVSYPPSTQPGELQFGVTTRSGYPTASPRCAASSCISTAVAPGRARAAPPLLRPATAGVAKKWIAPLLGRLPTGRRPKLPLWCDPRSGSDKAFLNACTIWPTNPSIRVGTDSVCCGVISAAASGPA